MADLQERWVDVTGCPGYQISDLGGFRNKRERVRYGENPNRSGYIAAGLRVEGKAKTVLVHRLVAAAFVPNPDNLPVVNHVNGVRHDNRALNLEWVTPRENRERVVLPPATPRRGVQVAETPLSGEAVQRTWSSVAAACRTLGISRAGILACCNGEKRSFAGSAWAFLDEAGTDEEWRPLAKGGVPFLVSSAGRVKTEFGHASAGGLVGGYLKYKGNYIHRLVALAFLEPAADGQTVVNHKDGNPRNNKVDNLEWATVGENARHAHLYRGRKQAVRGRTADGHYVDYSSMTEAASAVRVSCAQLSKVCDRRGLTAAGLCWTRVETAPPRFTDEELEAYLDALWA